jgi:hypothetical protein
MDKLLEKRPYLVAQTQPRATSADQGARGSQAQLTQEELSSMTPHEIVAARREGRLDSLMKGT